MNRRLWFALLLAVTACWGISFTIIHDAVTTADPYAFVAARFFGAAVLLLLGAYRRILRATTKATVRDGAILGFFMGAGYLLQTVGIARATPSFAGFLTGLSVVMIPILLRVEGRRLPRVAWIAIIVAIFGLAALTLEEGRFELTTASVHLLGCAMAYAVQVVLTSKYVGRHDVLALTFVELTTVAALGSVVAVIRGAVDHDTTVTAPFSGLQHVWPAIAFTAVACTLLAYLVMNWAQRVISAWEAGLVFAMEPAFAAGYSMLTQAEPFRGKILIGGAFVVCAMLMSEWTQNASSEPV